MALGNVIGATISNILGAFSLGLLSYKPPTQLSSHFDRSSTIYTVALFIVTGLACGILAFGHEIQWRAVGGTFIGLFALYIASIAYLIVKGLSAAPEELSNSSSDSGSDNTSDDGDIARVDGGAQREQLESELILDVPATGATDCNEEISLAALDTRQNDQSREEHLPSIATQAKGGSTVCNPVLPEESSTRAPPDTRSRLDLTPALRGGLPARSLAYHVALLAAGFAAIVLSSFVLSIGASNLVDQFGISDALFGVIILSIITTLPEKFVAVLSGHRGHMGIMVANTVGSNVFLLTLCLGVVWLSTDGEYDGGSVVPAEIAVMFGSTLALAGTILLGGRMARPIGVAMILGYVAFIVLEFTVIRG